MAVNETLNLEIARFKTVQVLKELGSEWMALIAPHRNLLLEFEAEVHVDARPFAVVGYVLTDTLILCKLGRGGRKQPWLLVELPRLVVTQPLSLDAMMRKSGRRSAASQPSHGVPPPSDGPRRASCA